MSTRITAICATLLLAVSLYHGPIASAAPQAPFEISIQDVASAKLGNNVQIAITQESGTETYGEFKFVVAFDPEYLEFLGAETGYVTGFCQWDRFEYNLLLCDSCDWQLVEISGVADDPGIAGAPICFSDFGDIAVLQFKILPDTTHAGDYAMVNFYWQDCESNTTKSVASDTTWYGKFAYDYFGNDITGDDPNFGGVQSGCIVPDGDVPIRAINTHNGGVQIREDFGVYGDMNADGRFNISDISYLINYIFAGGSAPKDYLHGDYDGDGITSITDAVFLMNYLFMLLGLGG